MIVDKLWTVSWGNHCHQPGANNVILPLREVNMQNTLNIKLFVNGPHFSLIHFKKNFRGDTYSSRHFICPISDLYIIMLYLSTPLALCTDRNLNQHFSVTWLDIIIELEFLLLNVRRFNTASNADGSNSRGILLIQTPDPIAFEVGICSNRWAIQTFLKNEIFPDCNFLISLFTFMFTTHTTPRSTSC